MIVFSRVSLQCVSDLRVFLKVYTRGLIHSVCRCLYVSHLLPRLLSASCHYLSGEDLQMPLGLLARLTLSNSIFVEQFAAAAQDAEVGSLVCGQPDLGLRTSQLSKSWWLIEWVPLRWRDPFLFSRKSLFSKILMYVFKKLYLRYLFVWSVFCEKDTWIVMTILRLLPQLLIWNGYRFLLL